MADDTCHMCPMTKSGIGSIAGVGVRKVSIRHNFAMRVKVSGAVVASPVIYTHPHYGTGIVEIAV